MKDRKSGIKVSHIVSIRIRTRCQFGHVRTLTTSIEQFQQRDTPTHFVAAGSREANLSLEHAGRRRLAVLQEGLRRGWRGGLANHLALQRPAAIVVGEGLWFAVLASTDHHSTHEQHAANCSGEKGEGVFAETAWCTVLCNHAQLLCFTSSFPLPTSPPTPIPRPPPSLHTLHPFSAPTHLSLLGPR